MVAADDLPPTVIRPVGFADNEDMLPYGARTFPGYRLLTEYFAFPHKFLFFDVTGLECLSRVPAEEKVELLLFHRAAVGPPHPVTFLRELKRTLVVGNGLFQQPQPRFERFTRREAVLDIAERLQRLARIIRHRLLLFQGADFNLRRQFAAAVNRGNQLGAGAAGWVIGKSEAAQEYADLQRRINAGASSNGACGMDVELLDLRGPGTQVPGVPSGVPTQIVAQPGYLHLREMLTVR